MKREGQETADTRRTRQEQYSSDGCHLSVEMESDWVAFVLGAVIITVIIIALLT